MLHRRGLVCGSRDIRGRLRRRTGISSDLAGTPVGSSLIVKHTFRKFTIIKRRLDTTNRRNQHMSLSSNDYA